MRLCCQKQISRGKTNWLYFTKYYWIQLLCHALDTWLWHKRPGMLSSGLIFIIIAWQSFQTNDGHTRIHDKQYVRPRSASQLEWAGPHPSNEIYFFNVCFNVLMQKLIIWYIALFHCYWINWSTEIYSIYNSFCSDIMPGNESPFHWILQYSH